MTQDEYKARAVVQKARELNGILAGKWMKGRKWNTIGYCASRSIGKPREKELIVRRESALHFLLNSNRPQLTAKIHAETRLFPRKISLNRLFNLRGVKVTKSFRRNDEGEQIDAAFEMDGWHYIVECRWRDSLADFRQLMASAGRLGVPVDRQWACSCQRMVQARVATSSRTRTKAYSLWKDTIFVACWTCEPICGNC